MRKYILYVRKLLSSELHKVQKKTLENQKHIFLISNFKHSLLLYVDILFISQFFFQNKRHMWWVQPRLWCAHNRRRLYIQRMYFVHVITMNLFSFVFMNCSISNWIVYMRDASIRSLLFSKHSIVSIMNIFQLNRQFFWVYFNGIYLVNVSWRDHIWTWSVVINYIRFRTVDLWQQEEEEETNPT